MVPNPTKKFIDAECLRLDHQKSHGSMEYKRESMIWHTEDSASHYDRRGSAKRATNTELAVGKYAFQSRYYVFLRRQSANTKEHLCSGGAWYVKLGKSSTRCAQKVCSECSTVTIHGCSPYRKSVEARCTHACNTWAGP